MMSPTVSDPKTTKRGGSRDVLASLPNTRPQRRSPKRDSSAGPKRAARPPARAASARGAGGKDSAAQKTAPAKTAAAKPRPAKSPAAKAAPAAKTAAPKTAAKTPAPKTAAPRPPVAAQGYHPLDSSPVQPPTGTEILASAVQAVGEAAQLGLTFGERLLRAATGRLPKR